MFNNYDINTVPLANPSTLVVLLLAILEQNINALYVIYAYNYHQVWYKLWYSSKVTSHLLDISECESSMSQVCVK